MAGGRWQVAGPLFPCKFGGFGGGVLFSLQKQNCKGSSRHGGGPSGRFQLKRWRRRKTGGAGAGSMGRRAGFGMCWLAGASMCWGCSFFPSLSPLPSPSERSRLGVGGQQIRRDALSTTAADWRLLADLGCGTAGGLGGCLGTAGAGGCRSWGRCWQCVGAGAGQCWAGIQAKRGPSISLNTLLLFLLF